MGSLTMTTSRKPHDVITVDIPYVRRNDDGQIPNHAQMFSHDDEFMDNQQAQVRNAREFPERAKDFSIFTSGFQYAHLPRSEDEINFLNDAEVKSAYYPRLEALLKEQLGASRVKAFHHVVRNTPYTPGMAYTRKHRCPARRPHVDVTARFAPILLSWDWPDMHPELEPTPHPHNDKVDPATDATGKKHWQMVNAWRPLKTIRRNPVCVADTRSMRWEDYMTVPQPEVGEGVEGYWLQRPQEEERSKDGERKHEWWYTDTQTPEEVLLFLQHDSRGGQVVAHTSFELPEEEEGMKVPRESIEVRLFVVYG